MKISDLIIIFAFLENMIFTLTIFATFVNSLFLDLILITQVDHDSLHYRLSKYLSYWIALTHNIWLIHTSLTLAKCNVDDFFVQSVQCTHTTMLFFNPFMWERGDFCHWLEKRLWHKYVWINKNLGQRNHPYSILPRWTMNE